jgi:prepilin-type N-terminal cleavage/methylation domain-containing protein
MKRTDSLQAGFTLVEIMIVVAIIGMLATMAIPNYMGSRAAAQRTTCINNLRLVDGAVQQWATERKRDDGEAVTYTDISGYLKHPVVCPSGGTTFADSYALTTVEAPAVCLRKPDTHLVAR